MKLALPSTNGPSSFWGFFTAALAGAAIGLCGQLYYLSYVSLENPVLRLWLGLIGGAAGGMLLVFLLGLLIAKLAKIKQDTASKLAGWALLATAAFSLPFWYWISDADAYWLPLALWVVFIVLLYTFMRPGHQTGLDDGPAGKLEKLIPLMVGLVVIGGLLLRLSGLYYNLPDIIPHSDTPKQIRLLPFFMQGALMVPDHYPVGHIYLYAALLKLFWFLAPLPGQAPILAMDSMAESSNLIIAARSLSACLAAGIPLIGYLAARRLWGAWIGLTAALFLALDPVHMTYSRQVMGDVPQAFWVLFSFYFSVRMFQEKRWWDCLLAGLFAGFAVSCKLYGGYIITAGFLAWLLASPRQVWMPLLLVLGLALGTAINTPYIFIDPEFWFANVTYMSAEQYGIGHGRTIWEGLLYSFTGLTHRFHLPWLLASVAGLVVLLKRHRKEDLLFLVPALLSIALIYGFRLRYLRQWDFVNLTIYYNMAAAVFLVFFLNWSWKHKIWNKAVPILVGLFLVFQVWTSLSDAWIARQQDTRLAAKSWMACLTRPGEHILGETGFSGAFSDWFVARGPGIESNEVGKLLTNNKIPEKVDALIFESGWADPKIPSQHLKPLLNIKVLHSHWEHPREALYRPDSPGYTGKVALPLFRADERRYAFWNTTFSRSLPLELLNRPGRRETTAFAQEQSVGWVGYLALGLGQGRLDLGPGLSTVLECNLKEPAAGMTYLLRAVVPLTPRTYQVGLDWHRDDPVWVGLFPQAQGMLPMLMRLGAWPELEQMARRSWQQNLCPEAGLMLTAALARRGEKEAAAQILKELKGSHPTFISEYKRLANGSGSDVLSALSAATGLGPAVLTWRRVVWSKESSWWGEQCNKDSDPAQEEKIPEKHHLWLKQEFLPGFFRLHAEIEKDKNNSAGNRLFKIVAHRPGVLVTDVAKVLLQPGQTQVELKGKLTAGPVRLEVILESKDADSPRLRRVELMPDLPSEFAWRWQTIQEQLAGLID